MQIKENVPLASYTAFGIGGPARWFCEVKNTEELSEAVKWAGENTPIFVLGGGSNILVSDAGFNGLVIKNNIVEFPHAIKTADSCVVEAGAGCSWDDLAEFAVNRNLAGIECLSGIPGTVGAAPVQNIGAYGQSAAETIESVSVFDVKNMRIAELKNSDCQFGYRTSVFKKNPGRYVITKVRFLLKEGGAPKIAYQDLQKKFPKNADATLREVREAVLDVRFKKGMAVKGEELHSSAGSFFKNPIVLGVALDKLKPLIDVCRQNSDICRDPWFWPKKDNASFKVSAACLMECAGFRRGTKHGRAGLSPLHSLAIVNNGGASAEEVMELARDIISAVEKKFGITLEIEPQLVGF